MTTQLSQDASGPAQAPARRTRLAAVAGTVLAVLLAVIAGLSLRPDAPRTPDGSGEQLGVSGPSAARDGVAETAGRRTFANLIARRVGPQDVPAIVANYAVVVLNDWDRDIARQIKQTDPAITVLMYQCLSSTRSSDRPGHVAGGVMYGQADADWFAVDTAGRRIEWDGYPQHWQMRTWDPDYQRAWVDSVLAKVAAGPWDGVLADNDYDTLGHYSDAVIRGTGSREETDRLLRSGLDELVSTVGTALVERGKLLVPNVSEGRYDLDRWRAHSAFGGAMEENFIHFGTDPDEDLVSIEWRSGGWTEQARQVATPGLTLAVTQAAPDDLRSMRYGYATLLVMGEEDSYWMTRVDDDTYAELDVVESLPEASEPVGRSLGPPGRQGRAWTRSYERVWAAVNPSSRPVTVSPPDGARTLQGVVLDRIELDPNSGVVLLTA